MQPSIDSVNDEKALVEAKDALAKARAALARDEFPGFGPNFGKAGTLTVESAERDKFHVTARSADAFAVVAKQLAAIVKASPSPTLVLFTDADRNAIPVYWGESISLNRLAQETDFLLGKDVAAEGAALSTESPAALLAVGSLLSQVAQFAQLFRTDKSLAYSDSVLQDEFLLDMIALEASEKVLYPTASLDAQLVFGGASEFATSLQRLLSKRTALELIKAEAGAKTESKTDTAPSKKDRASAVLTGLDAMLSRLSTLDPTTKVPGLVTVLRGELAQGLLKVAQGHVLSVKVAVKGGSSLKTSSIWRSDRLYASGGVVLSYRISDSASLGKIESAGVLTVESGFVPVPFK
ncbi:hypothetical protein J2X90_005970 [Variovorax paradoxus]|nr:hypothetical protein [Variovorax paradoxus]